MQMNALASLGLAIAVALSAGCGQGQREQPPSIVLLGERHDNAAGHAARLRWLQSRVDAGWRPVIAMEQFDLETQGKLDRARSECSDADCVIAMAAPPRSGWDWAHYRPVIELALRHGLPLVAANLSRERARNIVGKGIQPELPAEVVRRYRLDAISPQLLATQADEVRRAHCNQLPQAMLEPMARAQIARDVMMAEVLREHAARGVVLLAGNGHVRSDIGVPFWLRQQGLAPYRSIGYVEGAGEGSYDESVPIAPVTRPDACAGP